ncbi:hypothetical protein D3C76_698270 [compost metagenome]
MRTIPDCRQAMLEELRLHHFGDLIGNVSIAWHEILQEYGLAISTRGKRLRSQVDIDGTGDGICNAQCRGRQIACWYFRVHPAFEISVAGQHDHAFEALIGEMLNVLFELPRVADAGHATEARQIEAQCRKVFQQVGFSQVVCDHLRARRERRLDPRLTLKAQAPGLTGQQTRLDHLRRVCGVGTAGNSRHHHSAVSDRLTKRRLEEALLLRGCDQLAAAQHFILERRCGFGKWLTLVRLVRACNTRLDARQIKLDELVEFRLGQFVTAPQRLGAHVGDDLLAQLGRTTAELQVGQRLVVEREEHNRRPVLGRHVGDCATCCPAKRGEAWPSELHELAHDRALAQNFCHMQGQIGGCYTWAHGIGHADTDHFREADRYRFTHHGGLPFQPTNAPAQHTNGIDHRRVAVGGDHVVRVEQALPVRCATFPNDLGQRLHVHLVNDAGTRWDHTKVVQALLSPFDETVALAVAAEVDVQVLLDRVRLGVALDDHRVVDSQYSGDERVHRLWIATQLGDNITHAGEIGQSRQAGGVMEHQAVGLERYFAVRALPDSSRQH